MAFGEVNFGEMPFGDLTFGDLTFGEVLGNCIIIQNSFHSSKTRGHPPSVKKSAYFCQLNTNSDSSLFQSMSVFIGHAVEEFLRLCLLTFGSAYRVTGALRRFFENSPKKRFPSDSPGKRWGRASASVLRVFVTSSRIYLLFLGDAGLKFRNFDLSYLGDPSTREGHTRCSSFDDLYVASSLRFRGTSGSGNIKGRKFSGVHLQIL